MENLDLALLKRINEHFKHFDENFLRQRPCRITPQEVIQKVKNGEEILILDIRTKGETEIVGITFKNSLNIPLHELFNEENIETLTKHREKEIIVICHSGARTIIATAFLHLLGFDNAKSVEGGIAALADAIRP
jgi:rhodanese-related sulfurtransferase